MSTKVNLDDYPEEDVTTAIHEAGHVVAYLAYGQRFEYVTIVGTPNLYRGHIGKYPVERFAGKYFATFREMILTGLAGHAAESLESGDRLEGDWIKFVGSGEIATRGYCTDADATYVWGMMETICDSTHEDIDGFSAKQCEIANQFVWDNRKTIMAIAKRLLVKKVLTYDQVLSTVGTKKLIRAVDDAL